MPRVETLQSTGKIQVHPGIMIFYTVDFFLSSSIGSWNSSVDQLLAKHIREEDTARRIIWLSGWPEKEVKESGGHRKYFRENGWVI
jgi:hypothetical protein